MTQLTDSYAYLLVPSAKIVKAHYMQHDTGVLCKSEHKAVYSITDSVFAASSILLMMLF